jgi:uncharacterized protein GlcG (DUF336 family)
MFKKIGLSLIVSVLVCSPLLAEESPSISVKRLTLDAATKVAQAAIASCREKGIQIGVTVVDRNGNVQVAMRDSLAPTITLPISLGKANAAANFSVNTSALADRADTPIGRVPGIVMSAGGVLIEAGGSMYGAVGVSGAPSGVTDEECAAAGAAAVLEDLEMAM